jgi:ubiquinone/menaquinone biosynthesis C-methylase UbiE
VDTVVHLCLEGITAGSVLDIGTGTGVFAEAFAARGLQAQGIDTNPELLSAARAHVPGAAFTEAAAESLPFPDSSFDLVFLGHVLHEAADPAAALSEARRAARVRVAVLEWPYRSEEKGPPLEHRLSEARVHALASAAGFTVLVPRHLSHMDLYILAVPKA